MQPNETLPGVTRKFAVGATKGYVTVALSGGRVTDVFVSLDKEGSTLGGWVRAWAMSVSTGLQAGVPLAKIVTQYTGQQFEPRGVTSVPEVPIAKSIPDFVARWLWAKFGDENEKQ